MNNRIVGFLIIGIAALIGFIIFSFNKALTNIVNTTCTHGPTCPMWGTIDFQTNVSIGIMIFVASIGLYLILFGKEEKLDAINNQTEPKKITKENYQQVLSKLNKDEKLILEKIIEAQGAIFQSELVEKTNFSKAKVTRILDRLEVMGIIERRRRGMTNLVILKHKQ